MNASLVIRDYRQCAEKPGTSKSSAVKNKLREDMELAMEGEDHSLGDHENTKKISNVLAIKTVDSAMRLGIDRELTEFVCDVTLKPLALSEQEYLVSNDDLDSEFHREDVSYRACIYNSVTDQTRFSLPVEVVDHDALFIFSDQGSVGWVGWIYLFLELHLMGFFHWDICHHWWNELCNAMKKSGNWCFIVELIVVLNLCSGPWSGCAWFHTISKGI
jgi:hypothetical protein